MNFSSAFVEHCSHSEFSVAASLVFVSCKNVEQKFQLGNEANGEKRGKNNK